MDLKELEILGQLLLSPSATMILGIWMYFTIKGLRKEIEDLKKEIHNNGFVRKDTLEEKVKYADEVHNRHDREIDDLRGRIHELEVKR